MHLTKALTMVAATLLATGLLGLTPPAQATDPGGPIAAVDVNGVGGSPNADVPIDGIFAGGTASFGGGTFNCVGGTVEGIVDRGPRPLSAGPDVEFDALELVCATAYGVNATISIMNPGCVTATFADNNVHDGLLDTYTDNTQGHQYDRVAGQVSIPSNCVKTSRPGGCSAFVSGNINAFFDEAPHAINGVTYQRLHLNGTGLSLSGQTALCFGLMTGGITVNDTTFDVQVSGGTTTGIDFRPATPPPPTDAIAHVGVNGTTTAGAVPVDGVFESGTATFGGGTFGCSTGTVDGTVNRGPHPTTSHDLAFDTLDLTCATPLGINATISVADPGCVHADFADDNVHDGLLDTHTDNTQGHSHDRVTGQVTIPAACVTVTVPGGCTAEVAGFVPAYFDEAITAVGGVDYQRLHLAGTGLSLSNQTPLCFGLLKGAITVNDVVFDMQVSGGTTSGIDFRLTA